MFTLGSGRFNQKAQTLTGKTFATNLIYISMFSSMQSCTFQNNHNIEGMCWAIHKLPFFIIIYLFIYSCFILLFLPKYDSHVRKILPGIKDINRSPKDLNDDFCNYSRKTRKKKNPAIGRSR